MVLKNNFFFFPINKFNNYGRVTSKIEKDCNNPIIIEHLLFDSSERKGLLAHFKIGDYVSSISSSFVTDPEIAWPRANKR